MNIRRISAEIEAHRSMNDRSKVEVDYFLSDDESNTMTKSKITTTTSTGTSSCQRRIIFPSLHYNASSFESEDQASDSIDGSIDSIALSEECLSATGVTDSVVVTKARWEKKQNYQLISGPQIVAPPGIDRSPCATVEPVSILKTETNSSLPIISEDGMCSAGEECSPQMVHASLIIDRPKFVMPSSASPSLSIPSSAASSASSLPSLDSENSCAELECKLRHTHSGNYMIISDSNNKIIRKPGSVSFDPRIWVLEYEIENNGNKCENWYKAADIEKFRQDVVNEMRQKSIRLPSSHYSRRSRNHVKAILNLLQNMNEYNSMPESRRCLVDMYLKTQVTSILIVNSNETFLNLFERSFKYLMPDVNISLAKSSQEALNKIQKAKDAGRCPYASHGFDIVVIEERLNSSLTGSNLIRRLKSKQLAAKQSILHHQKGQASNHSIPFSLLIGVCAYAEDKNKMESAGADVAWTMPPPPMNMKLKNGLTRKIIMERNLIV